MSISRSRWAGTKRLHPFARAWLLIALSAFLLQSYVVQGHFHDLSHGVGQVIAHQVMPHVTGDAAPPVKAPLGKTPLDCPLCQAYAAASAIFVPMLPLLPLPLLIAASVVPHLHLRRTSSIVRRAGQSRAPPSLQAL